MTLPRRPTLEEIEQAFKADEVNVVLQTLKRLDWHALWADEEEEEWIHYPLIPARRLVALFSGAGIGKSLLMLELAAGLSTGRKVLGYEPAKRYRVLYIDFENDPRGDIKDRLQNMGYGPDELDHLDYLSFPSLAYLDTPQGANELTAAVDAYGSELVVIDTISRAVLGEENDNDTWLNFYKHSGLAMKQRGVALVRLDHSGKDETKGQRGGSAKSGDVDAIWRLSEITKGERFRLENSKARFMLETKELTLIRHDDPLCHSLEVLSAATDREARIIEALKLAEKDRLEAGLGRDKLRAWGKDRGLKLRNDAWSEVAKRRKNRSGLAWTPPENLSPPSGTGQNPVTVPTNGDSSRDRAESERKNLSPEVGDRSGTGSAGPTPGTVPQGGVSIGTPLGTGTGPGTTNGNGKSPKPGDQPCESCGEPLGWSMVRRGLSIHKPECPRVVTSG